MVLLEFAMTPHGKGLSVAPYVARILDIVDRSGITYQLTPMGTVLEGEWDAVMKVVGDCFRALEPECERIGMNLKMDWRRGAESRVQSKIDAVERELGRKLKT